MKTRILLTAFGLLSSLGVFAGQADAAGTLLGRVGTAAHVYSDTLEDMQSELYTNVFLRIHDDSGFTLNLSGRQKTEFNDDSDTDWNLYSAYLSWNTPGNRLTATLGRRLMFMGVIRGFQDGITLDLLRIHRASRLSFTLFGGQLAAAGLDPELTDADGSGIVGLAARAEPITNLELQMSSRFALEEEDSDSLAYVPTDMLGFLVKWGLAKPLSIDGGVEYDLTRERADRVFGRAAFTFSALSFHAEYFRTESVWIPKQSWYSRFSDLLEPRTQYRLGLDYRAPALEWLSGGLYWIADDSNEQSINAHVQLWQWLHLGYRLSGNEDFSRAGAFGGVHHSFSDAVRIDAGADFSRYSVYDLYDLPSYGSYARLSFNPGQSWRTYTEVQHRRNRIMDSDVRGLVGIGYRFRGSYGQAEENGGRGR